VHTADVFGVDTLVSITTKGALILKVAHGSVADKAGVKWGDVVYEYAGEAIATAEDLRSAVVNTPTGKRIVIRLYRNEKSLDATAQF
jgi:S1-C subfamily serine protease